jgi:hypothetical protein
MVKLYRSYITYMKTNRTMIIERNNSSNLLDLAIKEFNDKFVEYVVENYCMTERDPSEIAANPILNAVLEAEQKYHSKTEECVKLEASFHILEYIDEKFDFDIYIIDAVIPWEYKELQREIDFEEYCYRDDFRTCALIMNSYVDDVKMLTAMYFDFLEKYDDLHLICHQIVYTSAELTASANAIKTIIPIQKGYIDEIKLNTSQL